MELKLPFKILEEHTDEQPTQGLCKGCSDERFFTDKNRCWSMVTANVITVKLADGEIKKTHSCFHVKPAPPPRVVIPQHGVLPVGDETMTFSKHTVEDLDSVITFFILNWEMRIEIFDAFLAEYKRTGDLDKAIFFARCEWDL